MTQLADQEAGVMGKSGISTETSTPPVTSTKPIYTQKEKWLLVIMVAVAGLYSPLPANIYFPAIPELSEVFHQSTEALNQSVTTYLVFQGVCK